MVAEVIIMKEEKRGLKSHWKRIVRKKGFFPALYLAVAALLLTGVLWYQNANRIADPDINLDFNYQDDLWGDNALDREEPSEPVTTSVENISLPVLAESRTQIVTKFYDHDADQEEQEQALVFYNNKYYQSQGIDIAATSDEPLQVVAALSGEVVEVKENPLLGYIVQLNHDHDVTTYYSSLTDVVVEEGQKVSQGEVLAQAGTNLFNKDKGTHVHFEIRKDGKPVNPESYFEKPVADLTVDDDQKEPKNPEPELESGLTRAQT